MTITAKYSHTNLVAKNWQALGKFYQQLFGCIPVPPERDFLGKELEAGTGIHGAHIRGVHLRLPGYGDDGPTLEIFNYNILKDREETAVNRPGFGQLLFRWMMFSLHNKLFFRRAGNPLEKLLH